MGQMQLKYNLKTIVSVDFFKRRDFSTPDARGRSMHPKPTRLAVLCGGVEKNVGRISAQ